MRVDLKSLGTFNRIGIAGATEAAEALSMLTGQDTFVETTRIHFGPVDRLGTGCGDGGKRIAIEFGGALDGSAMLLFDGESAEHVLSNLEAVGPDPDPSYLSEVANIMTSSFVDGWAENFNDTIDISTPTVLDESDPLIPPGGAIDGSSFVFNSVITIDEVHQCEFYLIPEAASFLKTLEEQVGGDEDMAVGLDELTAFLQLTIAGADTVADQLETLTGMDAHVQVSYLDFVPVEKVPNAIGDETYLGTVFEFEGPMDGYLSVLFETDSAGEVASAMIPGSVDDDSMRRSAIEELGNITASGFIDGWANALGTTIDHTVPDIVEDMGGALLEAIATRLAQTQDFAYVFDVTITAGEPVRCRIFAFPDEGGFRDVVESLDSDIDVSSVERL